VCEFSGKQEELHIPDPDSAHDSRKTAPFLPSRCPPSTPLTVCPWGPAVNPSDGPQPRPLAPAGCLGGFTAQGDAPAAQGDAPAAQGGAPAAQGGAPAASLQDPPRRQSSAGRSPTGRPRYTPENTR
jgi:hypothetical protein